MNSGEVPGTLKQFVKSLTEITLFTTTILGYVLALVGRVPDELLSYATTVATITILISLAVLAGWRWPLIAKKRPAESKILVSHTENQPSQSPLTLFLAPFRSANNGSYVMPLAQRRLEGSLLLTLTVFAIGVTGMRFPKMIEEISGLHCLNTTPNALRIIIADFSPSDASHFEDSLANRIYLHKDVGLEICRYNRPTILLVSDAENTGKDFHASLVVWGKNNNGLIDVYFTSTAGWDISDPLKDGLPAKDSNDQVAFLAEQVASEILYFQGQPVEAQENLSGALENTAELQSANPELTADAHFLLGLLFDPDQYPEGSTIADVNRSIAEYSRAIRLNETLEKAYLNRASLYKKIGNTEKAIADYSKLILIARRSDYQFDAYLQKADLEIGEGSCSTAISDLETAFQTPEVDEYYAYTDLVHTLGKAYLLCKNYVAAERTYMKFTALNADDVLFFVEELDAVVVENPADFELREEVAKITKYLEQVQSP